MRAAGSTVLVLWFSFCVICHSQDLMSVLPDQRAGNREIELKSVDLAQRASQTTVADAAEGYVRLDVTVTDKKGKPVTGLGQQDFTLLDNGLGAKPVTFHAFDEGAVRPDPPTEVILVIDTVNLSPQKVATADRELEKFLRAKDGHLAQPTVIYRLTGWGLTRSEWPTTDGNALAAELTRGQEPQVVWQQRVRTIEPHLTADYARGRNSFSVTALGSIAIEERRRPGRKLLLWIGPGWPVRAGGESMFEEIVELSTRLREARITVSTVTAWAYPELEFSYENFVRGVQNEKESSPFDLQLEVLAIKSGGRVMEPVFDLAGSIARAIEGADDFYTLTFDPPRTRTVDEYHDLKVEIDRPDVKVRTDMGYYDEPVIYDQPLAQADRAGRSWGGVDELSRAPRRGSGA